MRAQIFAALTLASASLVFAQGHDDGAQDDGGHGSDDSASVVTVQVGATQSARGGIFQFIPPTITASKGTVVRFQFSGSPGNHTVTQSSFADPCTPLEGGFDSGFVFIPPNTSSDAVPEWNLTITEDDTPIWFFCKQLLPAPHCTAGMVGAINPPSSGNTFQAFQQNAQSFSGAPGQAQGSLVGAGASASALPGPLAGGEQLFTGGPAAASASSGSGPAHVPSAPIASGSGAAGTASADAGRASGGAAPTEGASGAEKVGLAVGGVVAVVAAVLGAVLV